MECPALAHAAQLVGALSHAPEGFRFNSRSGYMPRLWVRSLVRVHGEATNQGFSPPPSVSKTKYKMHCPMKWEEPKQGNNPNPLPSIQH